MSETLKEWHKVKARKKHLCTGCRGKICKDEMCYSATYADSVSKEIWTIWLDLQCYADMNEMYADGTFERGEEFNEGDIAIYREERNRK
jgi:hypothetical protein